MYVYFFRKQKLSAINASIKKKKECEQKALNVVIELIDGGLEKNVLLEKVKLKFCLY